MMQDDPISVVQVAQLLDALHCGAMLVDRDGRILRANEQLAGMIGHDPFELIGVQIESLCGRPEDRQFVRERIAQFGEPFQGEFLLHQADGGSLPVILSGRTIGPGEPYPCRLVTIIDISAQKAAEEKAWAIHREVSLLTDTVIDQALELKRYNATLEERVRERTLELREANMEAICMLAVASEERDADTGAHVQRIQHATEALARRLNLPARDIEQFGYSAILHDVGKITVPDSILKKAGKLTALERAQIEDHTISGERILSLRPFFSVARQIARSHHENWDGTGYPDRLTAGAIPLAARIVRLADVYDALRSPRVYKPAWSHGDANEAIVRGRETLFDPDVVDAFLSLVDEGAYPGQNHDAP